jgi:hypothetical protein
MSYVLRQAQQEQTLPLKQKALEPHTRYCCIKKKFVSVLIEFPDYKNPNVKGPEGAVYCENILPCYQENVHCRYSGISPLYPDPLRPDEPKEEPTEDELEEDPAED